MNKIKILILAFIALGVVSCGKPENIDTTSGTLDGITYKETKTVGNYIKIDTSMGIMIAELYPDIAPITVENFQKLIEEKFYDGTSFYRVIPSFVIQGGQFQGTKEVDTIKGEFEINGVENDLKHERGVLSMARANDYNSASSEFFIVHQYEASAKALNGKYAGFGMVIAGLDTIDKIVNVPAQNEYATNPPKINSIRFVEIEENYKEAN